MQQLKIIKMYTMTYYFIKQLDLLQFEKTNEV